jgi:hypothetical protein
MNLKNIRLNYMKKLNELHKIKSSLASCNAETKISPKKSPAKRSFLPVRINNGIQAIQNKPFINRSNANSNPLTVINSETEPETASCFSESSKVDTKPLIPHINCHLKNNSIRTLALSMSNLSKFSRCQSCNNCWLLTNENDLPNHRLSNLSRIRDKFSFLECKYLNYHKYLTPANNMLAKSNSSIELFSNSNTFKNDMTEALIRHYYKNDSFEQKCNNFVVLCPRNQSKIFQT